MKKSTLVLLEKGIYGDPPLNGLLNEVQNIPGDQSAFSGGSEDSRFRPLKNEGTCGGNDRRR